jgi:hypothetical protein
VTTAHNRANLAFPSAPCPKYVEEMNKKYSGKEIK